MPETTAACEMRVSFTMGIVPIFVKLQAQCQFKQYVSITEIKNSKVKYSIIKLQCFNC